MDNIRLILILAFAGILFMIYSAWIDDYSQFSIQQSPETAAQTEAATPGQQNPSGIAAPADFPDVEALPMAEIAKTVSESNPVSVKTVRVETDVLIAEISPQGGTIENVWLRDYSVVADQPENKFQLLKAQPPNMFIAQSGLQGKPQEHFPTHQARFASSSDSYTLQDTQDELLVELHWKHPTGIEVIKSYQFHRGSYLIEAQQQIANNSNDTIITRAYQQLQRTELHDPNKTKFVATYTGGVYYGPEIKYKKESFGDMTKHALNERISGGWIAMIQHYFMAAWIPPQNLVQTFYTKVINHLSNEPRYIIGQYSDFVTIASGDNHVFSNRLFIGPKLPERLAQIAPGLQLAIDYGWLTILAEPIHWLLSVIHFMVGNWGWSIIILTILIKLAFYKLSETSYKSMAHMRKLTPRMKALKDRYGDDKERLNQAMMELYKKEKINPLGGCLPILVQIPVFIALYWVLLESVELRHAPFIFWIDNLTAPDPYYVLPLIMGVSMFVQQKLNPPPPDPMQEKIMLALPVVFTVFFAFFPSGLVLYWTVNNLLSIAQQWHITRKIEQAEHQHKKV